MIESLVHYAAGAFAIVATLFGIWLAGKQTGKKASEAKAKEHELQQRKETEAIRDRIDAIVQETEKERNAQDITSVRDSLKLDSVRKPKD